MKRFMVVAGAACAMAVAAPVSAVAAAFSEIVVFGDSLSDVGNVQFGAGLLGLPDPTPAADGYFNGRFSNGLIYVDLLAASLADSSTASVPSLPQFFVPGSPNGTNFAAGGARAAPNADGIPDLEVQLFGSGVSPVYPVGFPGYAQYVALTGATGVDPNALYFVSIGNNDARAIAQKALGLPSGADAPTPADSAAAAANVLSTLVTGGAKHVFFMNAGDLGTEPVFAGNEAIATAASEAVNDAFDAFLGPYATTGTYALPGPYGTWYLTYFDFFDWSQQVVADPTAFGLPVGINTTTPCFLVAKVDPSVLPDCAGYAWADAIHPTSSVHWALANSIAPLLLQQVPAPASLALFGLGLGALAARRRGQAAR